MRERLQFRLIDAFAERPFRGNPAGVVLDADGLDDGQRQRIAAEVNASETAFVERLGDLHRAPLIRWFTPGAEVEFCGHATLAAAHALFEVGRMPARTDDSGAAVVFDSRVGPLRLTLEPLTNEGPERVWWLDMPDAGLTPDHTNPMRTTELLGLTLDDLDAAMPPMRTRDNDLIYFIREWRRLVEMRPRMDELAAWCQRCNIRGVLVATTNTLAESVNVQSRFFAPAVGVSEDPVTGSASGALAVYMVSAGQVGAAQAHSSVLCQQGVPAGRGGLVRALVRSTQKGYRARIGGMCFTTIVGEIARPEGE